MSFSNSIDQIVPGLSNQALIRGLQERNQHNLLEIFRAATPIMEEIAKVKPESWRNMRGLFTALESTFGIAQIGAGFQKPLNMLRNRASNVMEAALAPVMVGLNNISNQVESFALSNQTGAIIGGLTGTLIGAYFGPVASSLLGMFGSLIGGGIESIIRDPSAFLNMMQQAEDVLGSGSGLQIIAGGPPGDISGATQFAATNTPLVPLPTQTSFSRQMQANFQNIVPRTSRDYTRDVRGLF